jgi:hypothetical protein
MSDQIIHPSPVFHANCAPCLSASQPLQGRVQRHLISSPLRAPINPLPSQNITTNFPASSKNAQHHLTDHKESLAPSLGMGSHDLSISFVPTSSILSPLFLTLTLSHALIKSSLFSFLTLLIEDFLHHCLYSVYLSSCIIDNQDAHLSLSNFPGGSFIADLRVIRTPLGTVSFSQVSPFRPN